MTAEALQTWGAKTGPTGRGATRAPAVDADTFAMWRLDESSLGAWLTARDSGPNGYHLTSAIGTCPRPAKGSAKNVGREVFSGAITLTRASDAGVPAVYQGSWTFEAFVYLEALGGTRTVYNYSGAGELEANNVQLNVSVLSTGKLRTWWEYGAGSDTIVAQVAGGALVVGTWYHIAVVKDAAAKSVKFYVDGVLQDTVAYVNEATGGTTAQHYMGVETTTNQWLGIIASVRISNAVLSAATIAADAALKSTTGQHTLTAQTYALWQLDDAPDAADDCGNLPLTCAGDFVSSYPAAPLVNPKGRSRVFANSANAGLRVVQAGTGTAITAWLAALTAVWRGSHTWSMWCRPDPTQTTARTDGLWQSQGTGELQPANFYRAQLNFNGTAWTCTLSWESGAGVDQTWTSGTLFTAAQVAEGNGVHLAFVYTVAAGNTIVTVYVNGALVATSPAIAAYDGTGATTQDFELGTQNGGVPFRGALDEVRLSSVARSAAEILAMYKAGANGGAVAYRPHP